MNSHRASLTLIFIGSIYAIQGMTFALAGRQNVAVVTITHRAALGFYAAAVVVAGLWWMNTRGTAPGESGLVAAAALGTAALRLIVSAFYGGPDWASLLIRWGGGLVGAGFVWYRIRPAGGERLAWVADNWSVIWMCCLGNSRSFP